MYEAEGWTFRAGGNLSGFFDVRLHYACGIETRCGEQISRTPTGAIPRIDEGGIGSALELYYRGRHSDPRPGVDDLYWIQRVITNYPISPNQPGVRRTYIDNRNRFGNNAIYPYYAQGLPLASSGYFADRPYRNSSLDQDYYWAAELYLVEADKLNPREVTIYNGIR